MKICLSTLAFLVIAPMPMFAQTCAEYRPDPLATFTTLDSTLYLDLPNPDPIAAAFPLELTLVTDLIKGDHRHVTKTYCQIGVQRMIIDFTVPVEDDAVSDWVTRAVYIWNSADAPVGWQLDQLGERGRCARGDDPFAPICP